MHSGNHGAFNSEQESTIILLGLLGIALDKFANLLQLLYENTHFFSTLFLEFSTHSVAG